MGTVIKASLFCWGIVLAFLLFFGLFPYQAMSPVAIAVFCMSLGCGFLALLSSYIYRLHKKEGFEFGWFLARRNGFWLSFFGAVGLMMFLIGGIWLLAPPPAALQLEAEVAMPFAAFLAVLFWFALIFTFLGFAVVCYAESAGYVRIKNFKSAAGGFALATFWLALATLFCSLFLEVINDNFLELSGMTQRITLVSFALVVIIIGLCAGRYEDMEKLLPGENVENERRS